MSDSETSNQVPDVEQHAEQETSVTEKKKSGRGVMTDRKLENLAKARAARKANLEAKKYSKDKRGKAEERIEEEVKRRAREEAEKLADDLIKQRELEKELAEYRAWKKQQAQIKKEDADEPKSTEKGKKKPAPAKAKPKPPPKPRKKKVQEDYESDDEEDDYQAPRRPVKGRGKAGGRAPAHEEEDWLAGVLD
jgi:hypothetical protein